jgi:hypothetical protein
MDTSTPTRFGPVDDGFGPQVGRDRRTDSGTDRERDHEGGHTCPRCARHSPRSCVTPGAERANAQKAIQDREALTTLAGRERPVSLALEYARDGALQETRRRCAAPAGPLSSTARR